MSPPRKLHLLGRVPLRDLKQTRGTCTCTVAYRTARWKSTVIRVREQEMCLMLRSLPPPVPLLLSVQEPQRNRSCIVSERHGSASEPATCPVWARRVKRSQFGYYGMAFKGSVSAALPPRRRGRWPGARGHRGRTATRTTTFSSSQTGPGSADASAYQKTAINK